MECFFTDECPLKKLRKKEINQTHCGVTAVTKSRSEWIISSKYEYVKAMLVALATKNKIIKACIWYDKRLNTVLDINNRVIKQKNSIKISE